MATHFPQYSEVFQWLADKGWLVLQYTPADNAKNFGASLYALSPAGQEWLFRFNTHNDLYQWKSQAEVTISGDIAAEVRKP